MTKRGEMIRFSGRLKALEFFAGIGLARKGMAAAGIDTVWANDIDPTKCQMYRHVWGGEDLVEGNVFALEPKQMPYGDIAWASSPCTDLSLAGKREGIVKGAKSSAFFGFIEAIKGMGPRKPKALVLENVTGLASSHDGRDFRAVVESFNALGYSVDAFELNARRWLPQSRPRMFVVGLLDPINGGQLNTSVRPDRLAWIHGDRNLATHLTPLPEPPALLAAGLTSIAEQLDDDDPRWWGDERTQAFIESMSDVQRQRFTTLIADGRTVARTAYRRTRGGSPVWEVRDDDIAGCLRTARGGSSKQAIAFVGKGTCKVRWMTGIEYARLQGAGDMDFSSFRETQILYAFGDAVAVPAVTWLMENAVLPSIMQRRAWDVANAI